MQPMRIGAVIGTPEKEPCTKCGVLTWCRELAGKVILESLKGKGPVEIENDEWLCFVCQGFSPEKVAAERAKLLRMKEMGYL